MGAAVHNDNAALADVLRTVRQHPLVLRAGGESRLHLSTGAVLLGYADVHLIRNPIYALLLSSVLHEQKEGVSESTFGNVPHNFIIIKDCITR